MITTTYRSGSSWLHRISAGKKLFFLLVVSTLLLMLEQVNAQLLVLLLILIVMKTAKLLTISFYHSIRTFIWFIVIVAAYSIWVQGWTTAIVASARMLSLILLAMTVSMTTSIAALMSVLEVVVKPLDRLGMVNSERIALTFGITLRMIPELSLQWQEIREAQIARGVGQNVLVCIVPMIVRTLKRAQEIADAVDARY